MRTNAVTSWSVRNLSATFIITAGVISGKSPCTFIKASYCRRHSAASAHLSVPFLHEPDVIMLFCTSAQIRSSSETTNVSKVVFSQCSKTTLANGVPRSVAKAFPGNRVLPYRAGIRMATFSPSCSMWVFRARRTCKTLIAFRRSDWRARALLGLQRLAVVYQPIHTKLLTGLLNGPIYADKGLVEKPSIMKKIRPQTNSYKSMCGEILSVSHPFGWGYFFPFSNEVKMPMKL